MVDAIHVNQPLKVTFPAFVASDEPIAEFVLQYLVHFLKQCPLFKGERCGDPDREFRPFQILPEYFDPELARAALRVNREKRVGAVNKFIYILVRMPLELCITNYPCYGFRTTLRNTLQNGENLVSEF